MPLPALMAKGALTPFGGAALTGGLQFLGGMLNYGAQKQDYVNKVAYKAAQDEYSSWSASFQAKQANVNNKFQY